MFLEFNVRNFLTPSNGVNEEPLKDTQKKEKKDKYEIAIVTPESLKTLEGRKAYYDFLKNYPNIEPIRRIFGMNSALMVEDKDLNRHVRALSLYVHPDKVSTQEKEFCTFIFLELKSAQEKCKKREIPAFFGFTTAFSSEPKQQIFDLIVQQKWLEAKNLLIKFSREDLRADPYIVCLSTFVHLRLNDIESAIECSSTLSEKISLILQNCRTSLIKFDSPFLTTEEKKEFLLISLKEMHQLWGIAQQETQKTFSNLLPKIFVPYRLYSALSQCSRELNDFYGYEKYLREAVRFCPNTSDSHKEKEALVDELKHWIKNHYQFNPNITLKDYKIELCFTVLHSVKNLLSTNEFELINPTLCQYLSNNDITYLKAAINTVQGMANKKNYPLFGLIPSFIIEQEGVLCYSPKVVSQLNTLRLMLEGLKNYDSGNKLLAASDFLTAQKHFFLGIIQLEIREFKKAIESWQRVIEDPLTSANIREASLKNILSAINQHDLDFTATQLAEVDGVEEQALIALFKTSADKKEEKT